MAIRQFARGSLVCLMLLIASTGFAQNLDQLLKDAKKAAADAKKSTPGNRKDQNDGLPPGYDNSWRININYRATEQSHYHSTTGNECPVTREGSSSYSIQADLSSVRNVGFSSADEVDISSYAATGDRFQKFSDPLNGSNHINWRVYNSSRSCDTRSSGLMTGEGQIDPGIFEITFRYNKHTKEGTLNIEGGSMDAPASHITTGGEYVPALADSIVKQASMAMGGAFWACAARNIGLSTTQSLAATCQFLGGKLGVTETKNGYEAAYTATKEYTNNDGEKTTWSINVHISITRGNSPEYEAVIEPFPMPGLASDNYDDWVPQGPPVNADNAQNPLNNKGNTLAFHVRITDKKSGKEVTDLHPFSVRYLLDHVSHYQGYCMNYPEKGAAGNDDQPDLQWDSLYYKNNEHYTAKTATTLTSKDKEGSRLGAVITSYDYAAFGELSAHVHLNDDDIDLEAHLKGSPDELVITIPKDENRNKIADKWEKDVSMYGKTSDADFDEDAYPKNQRRNGDGYTLFEEYRGFKVENNLVPQDSHETFKNGHLRMDPNYKDIFIWDEDGLFRQYYAPYNPSDLCWHYINKNEMIFTAHSKDPENRWMNFNKTDHFYARQYALILKDLPSANASLDCSKLTVGQMFDYDNVANYGTNDFPDAKNGVPETITGVDQAVKHASIIMVFSGDVSYCLKKAYQPDELQRFFISNITGTVNHEIGHAIGIRHHWVDGHILLDADGNPDFTKGVINCSMRYGSLDEAIHHNIQPTNTYYCHKKDSWKEVVNTPPDPDNPGKAVPLKTITHESDNCYGQIDVKSDP